MAGLDQAQMPFNSNYNSNNNIPPTTTSSSNNFSPGFGGNGGGRNGYTVSPSKTISAPTPHNTTYANMPLASSAFVNGQPKPTGRATTMMPAASVSMTSFTEEAPVVIGSDTVQDPTMQSTVYADENELAKQEADELYTRLVKETRGALGHDSGAAASRGATFTRTGMSALADNDVRKDGRTDSKDALRLTTDDSFDDDHHLHQQSPPRQQQQQHQQPRVAPRLSDAPNYSMESFEDPVSYTSDRGNEDGQDEEEEEEESEVVSPHRADDSQDDDF